MSSRTTRAVVVAGAALLLTATLTAAPTSAKPGKANNCDTQNSNTYAKLLDCVTVDGVMEHERAFQAIADANGGTRADQTPGYQASVDYVVETLEAAGWSAEVVPFSYAGTDSTLQQLTPVSATYSHNVAVGSGEGDVSAAVVPVDINLTLPRTNSSGCEAADFVGFPAGAIALVQRGGCGFVVKAQEAQAAGAGGVIIFNQGDTVGPGDRLGAVNPTLAPFVANIPVVGVSFADGAALAQAGSTARLKVDFVTRESFNVIGELAGKNTSNVVMAGAHLDSVPAGPGINDNGSGSSGLLDVAQALGNHKPQNTVRFAWWGAEELGLIGSTQWVGQRTQAELDEIALYLNFDMIGSPNYYFGVYDADESSFVAPVPVPEGSIALEDTFESYYTWVGEPYDDSAFSGRSDYQAFINKGIPSSGLFTGAEVVKTAAQEAIWGGTAGLQFDPCYHQACDTVANLNHHALHINSDAVAFAVLTYAYSTESVNGVVGRAVPGGVVVPAPAGPEHTFAGPLGGDSHDHDHEAASR